MEYSVERFKEELTQELVELTTLCDINACMIIHDPTATHHQSFIWPTDRPDQVRRLIDSYRSNIAKVKSCGVLDFLVKEKKRVEAELLKLRKLPTASDDDCLDLMNEDQLRGLDAEMRTKSEMIRSMIQMRNDRRELEMIMDMLLHDSAPINTTSVPQNCYDDHQIIQTCPYTNNIEEEDDEKLMYSWSWAEMRMMLMK